MFPSSPEKSSAARDAATVPSSSARQIRLRVIREPAATRLSPRVREICWDYGVPPRETPRTIADNLAIELRPGGLIYLAGPSGSGKTALLAAIADACPDAIRVEPARLPADRAIVDAVAPRAPLAGALEILTACGLGEPRLWLRRPCDLSDGERFRAALARAIGHALGRAAHAFGRAASSGPVEAQHAAQRNASRPPISPILCDEFTALLHRRLARAVAHNLRKLVTRRGLVFVAAGAHEDILEDLQPDLIVRLGGDGPETQATVPRERAVSLQRQAYIEAAGVRDYAAFGTMHYRCRDGLGFVDRVFVLRRRADPDPLGILVFAHAPMELALRNRATQGRFTRNLRRLNREMRILRRLVMHPDVRGCGLGHWFVRRTLPRVGVRFVECLATMGAVNPVFEKSGMRLVGPCPLPRGRIKLLERLARLKIDPFTDDFERRIACCPRVRRMVEQTIRSWVQATQSSSPYRVGGRGADELCRAFRQLIGRPAMYYLWDRDGEFPKPDTDDVIRQTHGLCARPRRSADADDGTNAARNACRARRLSPFSNPMSVPRRRRRPSRDPA